jgi:hypothetical protein
VKKKSSQVHFRVQLTPHEMAAVIAAFILITIIGVVTALSPLVSLTTFGLYLALIGAIMLGFGLAKTNDEMLALTNHYEDFHRQELVARLTRDRFFVVLGVFLISVGILVQILGVQFFV